MLRVGSLCELGHIDRLIYNTALAVNCYYVIQVENTEMECDCDVCH